jgi:tol-pal system protein YbgF
MCLKKIPLLIAMLILASATLLAGTKEELVRLQNDVLTLQNQLRLLENSFNEQMQGLKSLVVQLNDQIGVSNKLLGKMAASLEGGTQGQKTDTQAILQEIRNLKVRVDDTATTLSALALQVSEMKVQSKAMNERAYQSASGDPAALSLSADTIFNEAYSDLVQGNFDLAIEGFSAFIKSFPSNEKADDAQYNIGEAYYNSRKLQQAIAAFTRVIDDYPNADKVASAYFKRGTAEVALGENENAIEDFKLIVQKYPAAAEASLAKTELENLGVNLSRQTKPAAKPRRKP